MEKNHSKKIAFFFMGITKIILFGLSIPILFLFATHLFERKRGPMTDMCQFSDLWSWNSDLERHNTNARRAQGRLNFANEELRWALHDIQNQRFLPSDTVRTAYANAETWRSMATRAAADLRLHQQCAAFAELKMQGKSNQEAFSGASSRLGGGR